MTVRVGNDGTLCAPSAVDMTALRCVIDMTIRLGGANCKGALSYWGRDAAQPRLHYSPGASSFPRKREPTGRTVRLRESGNLPHSPDYGYGIPAFAGMTVMGTRAPEWVPAYAGMTVWVGNDGTLRAPIAVPSPAAFAASSPLIEREGFGACAPLDSCLRGNDDHGGRWGAEWIPAYAGMTVRVGNDGTLCAPSAVPSPRRVRGVLSPYRERGDSALARLWIPAYAGMTVCYAKVSLGRRGIRRRARLLAFVYERRGH